jgi:hypothetical protein
MSRDVRAHPLWSDLPNRSSGGTGPGITGPTGPTGATGATGGTGLPVPEFVFRPGGVPGGYVYTTEASLATATQALGNGFTNVTPYVIVFDLTLNSTPGVYTITSTPGWALAPYGTWTDKGEGFTVVFANGTIVGDTPNLAGALKISITQTSNCSQATLGANPELRTIKDDASITQSSSSSGSWVNINPSSTYPMEINASGNASLTGVNAGTNPLLNGKVNLFLEDAAQANHNIVSTANGTMSIAGPACQCTSDVYAVVSITGLFTDLTGTGTSSIPAMGSGAMFSSNGLWIVESGAWVKIAPSSTVDSSFVFQPGGTQAGNVYTSEADLAAATQLLGGATYEIFFDGQFVSFGYAVTTVGTWNLAPGGRWTDRGQGMTLNFNAGTTLANLPIWIDSIQVQVSQTSNVYTLASGAPSAELSLTGGANIFASNTGLFINNTGGNLNIYMHDTSALTWEGESGTPIVAVSSTGFLLVYVEDSAHVEVSAVSITSTANGFIVAAGPEANIDPSYYPYLSIGYPAVQGFFNDASSGTGHTTIPAANNTDALLYSDGIVWQSNGTAWVPVTPQSGTTTLVNGLSPVVSVPYLDANSHILCDLVGLNATTAIGILAALSINRTVGSPGSFRISSLVAGTAGTVEAGDQSTVEWTIVQNT